MTRSRLLVAGAAAAALTAAVGLFVGIRTVNRGAS